MSVPKKYEHIDFKPTEAMANEAETGLEWREQYNRGGTEVGVARARDIKNRRNLSPDTVRRMHSFFQRHESNKTAEGWNPGEKGYPSAGKVAHKLWGGDSGQSWAKARVEQMDTADSKEKSIKTGGHDMGYYKSRRAAKGFKLENTLKSVQSMRKSLIEANRQAMLAGDELEDAAFMGDEVAVNADGVAPDLETAMAACREISDHLKAAIEASEEAKTALRGDTGGRGYMAEDLPLQTDQETVRRYTSGRARRSLKARRQWARQRRRMQQ